MDELLERVGELSATGLLPPTVALDTLGPAPDRARRRRRIVAGALAAAGGTGLAATAAFGLLDGAHNGQREKPSQTSSTRQAAPPIDSSTPREPRATVVPHEIKASRSSEGHEPTRAFDGFEQTWWGPGVSGSGRGEWIEARFETPARLTGLVLTSGMGGMAGSSSSSALPHRLAVTITTAAGETVERELTLDRVLGGQHREFDVGEVSAVRFTIRSSYDPSEATQVAISGIEFRRDIEVLPPAE
ncbi:NADase-type glycan-binding domain-containing protein [Streptomyces marokkonensis]|uniref:NADase-type glycan-binding domain-containing protein n=1 Tax=Streptomyces marokkonensis TaxID=324855 RepID=UPI003CD0A471